MKNKIIIYFVVTLNFILFLSLIYFSYCYYENKNNKIQTNDKYFKVVENENKLNVNSVKNNFTIKLSFVGDMMLASNRDKTTSQNFNGYVNKKEPSYFLKKVKYIFEEDDFTIVNLENVFTDRKLRERSKKSNLAFWFKSKTSNIRILTSSSVEGVSIANNHINDYGKTGKSDTIDTVTNANIQYGDADNIMYFKKNNFTVAVICKGLWIESQATEIIELIKEAEKYSDYQIVFFHGGTEKVHKPENWKRRASKKIIDNGADLVIGAHPHVLQPIEVYNGKEIVYSLGNFCYGGHKNPENRTIIYQLNLIIDNKTNTLLNKESNIIPCYVYTGKDNNYQPAVIEDESIKNKVIDFMNWKNNSPL